MANDAPLDTPPYVAAIKNSGKTIYDPIIAGDPLLWIPSPALEKLLNAKLVGMSLAGLPIRTRSRVVKEAVCNALGYPVPRSFRKTQPRFPGQEFDTYIQKANNLQIWNEDLSPTRRYVLVRPDAADTIVRVRVVTGDTLAKLNTTGTLTQKYQARCIPGTQACELVSKSDTPLLAPLLSTSPPNVFLGSPAGPPQAGQILPIHELLRRLQLLLGHSFPDAGATQDRNRGAALHKEVCSVLGYKSYRDGGQFPDLPHQLLEVKLQTSPTIDLGLVEPISTAPLDVPAIDGAQPRHCDVRYAVFYGRASGGTVAITNLILTTGKDFFGRLPRFEGKVLSKKIQIPLPSNFFN
jgi:hypothetical protein